MLTTVKLYGVLGKEFGKEHKFDIDRPNEAIKALMANYPTFEKTVIGLQYGLKIYKDDKSIYEPMDFIINLSKETEIKIIPIIAGSDFKDVFMIVAGIFLIAVSWWNPTGWGLGAHLFGAAAAPTIGEVIGMVGMSLLFMGVANLLFQPPELPDDGKESYRFSGPINTVRQGNVVSVGYGTLWVGSQLISGGLQAGEVVELI